MALFTETDLRQRAANRSRISTASVILNESRKSASAHQTFDVFLSHSIKDAELILGVKLVLEANGKTVYVDWINDSELDRAAVTSQTAERLRARMRTCKTLIYAHSVNSPHSKWMPWELGYFDGFRGAVLIFPISKGADSTFRGQEFVGIYPYIDTQNGSVVVEQGSSNQSRVSKTATVRSKVMLSEWFKEFA